MIIPGSTARHSAFWWGPEEHPGEPVFVVHYIDGSTGVVTLDWMREAAGQAVAESVPPSWTQLYIGGLPEPGLHQCVMEAGVIEPDGGQGMRFVTAIGYSVLYQCSL